MHQFFLAGTYSEPILFGTGELFYGKGEGVYLCGFDGKSISIISCLKVSNPSFIAIDEEKKHIYAVNEGKEFNGLYGGGVTDISYDASGDMKQIHSFNTGGCDPCHIAISPEKGFIGIANFADGRVTVFPLSNNGNILDNKQLFCHSGNSIHPLRQKGPHAHSVLFSDDGKMYVPDLGIDKVKAYSYTDLEIVPDEKHDLCLNAGSGPRSGEWSADMQHLYLINELGSSITHFYKQGSLFSDLGTVSTLPDGADVDNICADLHLTPDGRFLYASNRGHNSIASFRVLDDGSLEQMGWIPCGGRTPRNFAVDPSGKYVLVGNQDSDNITVFLIREDGSLEYHFTTDFPTPVCIKFFYDTGFDS